VILPTRLDRQSSYHSHESNSIEEEILSMRSESNNSRAKNPFSEDFDEDTRSSTPKSLNQLEEPKNQDGWH